MSDLLAAALGHLEALVGFDTRNPPRAIGTGGMFDYLRAQLADFRVEVTDHGAGAVSMLAVRGEPQAEVLLLQLHGQAVGDPGAGASRADWPAQACMRCTSPSATACVRIAAVSPRCTG